MISQKTVIASIKYLLGTTKSPPTTLCSIEPLFNRKIIIKCGSREEALMKMDLENLPALMFKNAATNRMNIVYYRRDGNISWVDSK